MADRPDQMAVHSLSPNAGLDGANFRDRAHTLPGRPAARPVARLARDPVQPSAGSLTRLSCSKEEAEEDEDDLAPMMRPRSNTAPEKRALQMLKRRIRNRPPTPPPQDISPSPTGSIESFPRERASSLTRSRERLGALLPGVPEDQKDRDTLLDNNNLSEYYPRTSSDNVFSPINNHCNSGNVSPVTISVEQYQEPSEESCYTCRKERQVSSKDVIESHQSCISAGTEQIKNGDTSFSKTWSQVTPETDKTCVIGKSLLRGCRPDADQVSDVIIVSAPLQQLQLSDST